MCLPGIQAELKISLELIGFSKDMLQASYGLDVYVFIRHSDLHVLEELNVYSRQLRADIYVEEL